MSGLFALGVLCCWVSAVLTALSNILFKYHETVQRKHFSWKWVGIFLVLLAAILDIAAFAMIPVSVNQVHSCLPIILGEIFSSWILKKKLGSKQWAFVIMLLPCVILGVLYGPRESDSHVTATFQESMQEAKTISCVVIAFLFTTSIAISTRFLSVEAAVNPLGLYNIIGPLLTACMGAFTVIGSKLFAEVVAFWVFGQNKCGETTSKTCVDSISPWFATVFLFLPLCAGVQLMLITFIMGKLNLVMVIPIYGSLLILLPTLLGMSVFKEEPINQAAYWLSVVGIIVTNICFLAASQENKDDVDEEEVNIEVELPPI
jgi:hypothetical protein